MKKFKNFVILVHYKGYVCHIDNEQKTFNVMITQVPLDKKKHRLKMKDSNYDFDSDAWATIPMSDISEQDQSKITMGYMLDWYLGYSSTRYKKRISISKIIFLKKGKQPNMKEIERRAKKLYKNVKWR